MSNLYVIADASASFFADGKDALMENLILSLMNNSMVSKYSLIDNIFFLAWNDDLNEIEMVSYDQPFAGSIEFGGKLNFSKIIELFEKEKEDTRALLLSDGVFSQNDINDVEILTAVLQQKNDVLMTVAVGADADIDKLKTIAFPVKKCYKAEDVLTAFNNICMRSFKKNSILSENGNGLEDKKSWIKRR